MVAFVAAAAGAQSTRRPLAGKLPGMTDADRSALLDRLLRYVRVDTQSDPESASVPSTSRQLDLSRMLADECRAMGMADVSCSEAGVVIATVPGRDSAPAVVFNSHVDTSPESPGENVQPQVVNYEGGDITLPGDPTKVIRADENPELNGLIGTAIITSDGTTLLGADDKAGIAIIMTAADILMRDHGGDHAPLRVVFTVDEEIGRGTEALDVGSLDAICGYTLDGGGRECIDTETFSADGATVTVRGVNIHPSIGYGRLVNAVKILGEYLAELPADRLSPETTVHREGFVHPVSISGGVEEAKATFIIRDFETDALESHAGELRDLAATVQSRHSGCSITVETRPQYRNMRDGLQKEPRAVLFAVDAMTAVGLPSKTGAIRGGTDGSLMTAAGLPTPNIFSGQHTPHSLLEWASLAEMQDAVAVVVEIAKRWGNVEAE